MKEKLTKKRILSSLAMRIFFINAIVLVLPLLIHSLISYRQEYEVRLLDTFQSLQIIGTNRARLIQELFTEQEKILRLVEKQLLEKRKNFDVKKVQREFLDIVTLANASNLFYLTLEKSSELKCKVSAKNCDLDNKRWKTLLGKKRFQYARVLEKKVPFFYVGITLFSPKDPKKPVGLLIIANRAESMVRGLANFKKNSHLTLSFVGENDLILASSDASFQGRTLSSHKSDNNSVLFSPFTQISGGFLLQNRDLAVKFLIPELPGFMLLSVPISDVHSLHRKAYIYRLATLFFLIVVIGGGFCVLSTIRMAQPMRKLFAVMDALRAGDMQARYKKDPLGFEINTLGQHFNSMMKAILEEQKRSEKERAQKEIYEKELRFGHDIQESLLRFDRANLPIDVESYYDSSQEVGGDFYDLFLKDGETVYFSLADVSGKGVSACLYSLGFRSSLRTSVVNASLSQAMQRANHFFCIDAKQTGMFASIWAGYYHTTSRILTYLNAGHWPALFRKNDGSIHRLDTQGPSIGLEDQHVFVTKKISVDAQDVLVIYSDGIIEMRGEESKMYGRVRLEQSLENTEGLSAKEIVEKILKDYDAFRQGRKPEDDVTILVIRF